MTDEHLIVVAIEDLSTAGAVAAEAVRLAIKNESQRLILVHVLDDHPVLSGMLGLSGSYSEPLKETEQDGERILDVADQVIHAEYAALNQPAPQVEHEMAQGHAGTALARIASARHAEWLVVGARRPHLFGRLTHPDVRAHLQGHSPCRVHVAPLQEVPSKSNS